LVKESPFLFFLNTIPIKPTLYPHQECIFIP
jgi:hypothetical protein